MSFSKANAAGWAYGEILTSTQMNTVDTNQSRAVDGNAGGTYTPSGAITINGSGVSVGGSGLTCTNGATVSSGGITVSGGGVSVSSGGVTVSGGGVSVTSGGLSVSTGGITLTGGGTSRLSVDFRPDYEGASLTYQLPLIPTEAAGATDWDFYASSLAYIQQTTNTAVYFPLVGLPDNSTINSLTAHVSGSAGASGSYGSLPSGMPTLKIEKVTSFGTVSAISPTATDDTDNVSSFNNVHQITVTPSSTLSVNSGSPALLYARLDGVGTGFESNKFGIIMLTANVSPESINP